MVLFRFFSLFFLLTLSPVTHGINLYVHSNTPPFEWKEEEQEEGFNLDVARKIATASQESLKVQRRSLFAATEIISRQDKNGIAFVADTPVSQFQLARSMPLLSTYASVYNRVGEVQVANFNELIGLKVGVKRGSFIQRYLQEQFPHIQLFPYQSNEVAFAAMTERELDVVVAEFYCAWRLLMQFHNIKTASPPLINGNFYLMSNPLNLQLAASIDEEIERLYRAGQIDALVMKWMGFGKEKLDLLLIKQKTYEIGTIIGVLSFFGFILTLLISYKLRRKKHQLQQELNVRKLAEQRVSEVSLLFQSVLDDLPHGISIWDKQEGEIWSNGKLNVCTPSLCFTDMEDKLFDFDLVLNEFFQSKQAVIFDIKSEGNYWQLQLHLVAKGQALIMLEDTTERMQLRIDSDMTSRLIALGEISAGIAHEINNPLGLIAQSIRHIQHYLQDSQAAINEIAALDPQWRLIGMSPDEAKEEVSYQCESIEQAVGNMSRIVQDLKCLSRPKEMRNYGQVSLNSVIECAIRMTSNSIKRLRLNWLPNEIPLMLYGDEVQLQLIVINFIQNACNALTDNPEPQISINTGRQGNRIWFEVKDNGSGMDKSLIKRIKEPFFTTRRGDGGTGIGLAICDRIIQEHGGKWSISSLPNQGTTMLVEFDEVMA